MNYNIAIIGGGPGGYTAAVEAAKCGKKVVLFEKDKLGGTCLNRGCIPTKSLIHAAEIYESVLNSKTQGIFCEKTAYDFAAMHEHKNNVVDQLRSGINELLKKHKVEVIEASAQIMDAHTIKSENANYTADNIIIATGSIPHLIPIPGITLPGVYTSNTILEGNGCNFESLIVIGGGVVGVEIASFYHALGCEIRILDACDRILPTLDKEISQRLSMHMKKSGIGIETSVLVKEISGKPGNMNVLYENKKGEQKTITAQGVLVSTGRLANIKNLFSPEFHVETKNGAVVGDRNGSTSISSIYVIGDAQANNVQLAHVASSQAKNVIATINGTKPPVDLSIIPSCVYTNPEIACVGLSETEAKKSGIVPLCGKSLTGSNGKCLIECSNSKGNSSGFVKIVTNSATGIIIGAQMMCPRATDMISELALAIQKKMTIDDLLKVMHPHPTISELIQDAADMLHRC